LSAFKIIMMKASLLFVLALLLLGGCKKDNDQLATGTVLQAGGCFPDAWLVAVDNPDPEKHFFIRKTIAPAGTMYNCSNAVFMRLPASLAVAGTRIKFKGRNIEPSCFSYSEAPNIITVEKISKL
jgi:hypothetical protein